MKSLTDLAYQILGMMAVMAVVVVAILIVIELIKQKLQGPKNRRWSGESHKTYVKKIIPVDYDDEGDSDERTIPPYYKKMPLTDDEQKLFIRLMEALPINVILAQVSMQALIGIKPNPNERTQRNKIDRKYVDFVICRPDFSVEAVIELDDSTHERPDRKKSDAVKDVAFSAVNCPLIRFHVRHMPSVEEIREAIHKVHC